MSNPRTTKERFFVCRDGGNLIHRFNTHKIALDTAKKWAKDNNSDDYFVGQITEIVTPVTHTKIKVIT